MAGRPTPRVLSIQSHVVSGYVGNKSAVFPLQLHGIDVCPLNSVQFSNHVGYGKFVGEVLDGEQLAALIRGLQSNDLLRFSHVLTGYARSPSFLRAVVGAISDVRTVNPDVIYVCDPVLGDDGALYVPEDQVKIYRDEVLPAATLLTPNQFECEVLTGIRIDSEAAAVRAMAALHGLGVPAVVITSATLGDSEQMSLLASVPWSMVSGNADVWESPGTGACARFRIDFPKLPFKFTGTGDLTASLLLAWLTKLPASFVTVCEQSLASVQAVCHRTMEMFDGSVPSAELRIVESKVDLEAPTVTHKAKPIA